MSIIRYRNSQKRFLGFGILLFFTASCLTSPLPTTSDSAQIPTPTVVSTLPLVELWCLQSDQPVSRPIVHQGLVLVQDMANPITTYRAYQADSGDLVWTNKSETGGTLGYSSIEDNWFVTGDQTFITTFEVKSGIVIWQDRLWISGFSIGEGKLFAEGPEWIRAYNLSTGEQLWQLKGQGRGWSATPLYDPINKVVVFYEQTYRLVDPETGVVLTEKPRPPENEFGLGTRGSIIYKGLILDGDHAIEVLSGRVVHTGTIHLSQSFTPVVIGDYMLL